MRIVVSARISNTSLQLLSALIALLSCGCAFMNRDNTRALNFVENKLWPDKTHWKIAASPLVVPLGLAAVITDAVIIHPASVIDDAAGDAGEALWSNMQWDQKYVTACASLPWRCLATPPLFAGNFLGRSMFDVPSRASEIRQQRESAETLEQARKLSLEENYLEAIDLLKKTDFSRLKEADQIEFCAILFKAAHKTGLYDYLHVSHLSRLLKSDYAAQAHEIMNEMRESPNPVARWRYFILSIRIYREWRTLKLILSQVLSDQNPIIRYYGLSWFDKRGYAPELEEMIPKLELVEKEDPDPMNRAYAEQILRRFRERK